AYRGPARLTRGEVVREHFESPGEITIFAFLIPRRLFFDGDEQPILGITPVIWCYSVFPLLKAGSACG
ncbi:MAG: hypothetical protein QXP17_03155, partial [Candidatus Jordarchaeales archaeon]